MGLYKDSKEPKVQIAVVLERVEQGWVATAPEVRATAQGDSQTEAMQNLVSLFRTYPDVLSEVRDAESHSARRVELIAV